jgi:hypothetical protein
VHPLALPPFCCLCPHLRLHLRPFPLRPFCCLHLHLRPVASSCVCLAACVQLRPHLRPVASALASACVCTCVRLPCVCTCVRLRLCPLVCFAACVCICFLLRLHLRPLGCLAPVCLASALASVCLASALASVRLPCVRTCVPLRPFGSLASALTSVLLFASALASSCLLLWLFLPWWGPLKKPTLQPTTPLIRSFSWLFTFDYYEVRPFEPKCTCLPCLRFVACVRTCVFTCVRLPCIRYAACTCICVLLRLFGCLRPVASPLASALASVWLPCVGTCVRFAVCVCTCVQLLVAMALLALVGPTKKTNIATNHPPYPFV